MLHGVLSHAFTLNKTVEHCGTDHNKERLCKKALTQNKRCAKLLLCNKTFTPSVTFNLLFSTEGALKDELCSTRNDTRWHQVYSTSELLHRKALRKIAVYTY